MYATQMIKDLQHYLVKKLPLMEDELNTLKYREQIKTAIQQLRTSPQVVRGSPCF